MVGEALDVARGAALAQQLRDHRVRPGRPAQTEVDAPGSERLERRELLRDHERRVVRQHDAARSEADPRGAGSSGRGQYRRRRRGDRRHVVVLGEPVPPVPQPVGGVDDGEGCRDRLRARLTGAHRNEVENGQGEGGPAGVCSVHHGMQPPAMSSAFRGRAFRRVARIRRQGIRFVATRQECGTRGGERGAQGRRLPFVRFSRNSVAVWRAVYAGRSRSSRHDSLSGPALTVSKPRAS